jgi:hypothetical protein
MRITQNDMRKELAKNVARMHEMRGEALSGGKMPSDIRIAFRRETACAMSYVEAIEDASIANPRLDRLLACTSDPAFAKYDSTQDKWWMTNDGGKEFLSNLRLLTLHYMHAGAQGAEDAFFMFQVIKCRFEKDPQSRVEDGFLQPAYGGLWLPSDKDYTGALMRHLSNDMTVKVVGDECRLVLRLDWWPDVGEVGVRRADIA